MATKTTKTSKTAKPAAAKTAKSTKAVKATKKACDCRDCGVDERAPITTLGFLGYQILFAIPVVGWVLCISFALMAQNHNLRSFARAQLVWLVIWVVSFCALAGFGGLSLILKAFGAI